MQIAVLLARLGDEDARGGVAQAGIVVSRHTAA
jgi:hypothetical protein